MVSLELLLTYNQMSEAGSKAVYDALVALPLKLRLNVGSPPDRLAYLTEISRLLEQGRLEDCRNFGNKFFYRVPKP